MKFFSRMRILPLLVLVAMLSFAVRAGEFWTGLRHMGSAMAQEKVNAEPPPMPADAQKPDASKTLSPAEQAALDSAVKRVTAPNTVIPAAEGGTGGTDASSSPPMHDVDNKGPALPSAKSGEKVDWRSASDEQVSCSDAQAQLDQDLAKRRDQLDKQEKELATRKALLDAAQHELDQKVSEMTNLRNEIKGMMDTLSDEEKARIASLVKIYSNMKPADAARIFNTLDMDVLIQVVAQMKEAKASPIIAAMSADRAKTVTVMLAQQKKLPDVPPVAP